MGPSELFVPQTQPGGFSYTPAYALMHSFCSFVWGLHLAILWGYS